jgi:tetratricopeptide (TPR) repeat protein
VKTSRSLISFLFIFVAGFLAGVVFSAWKLEAISGRVVKAEPDRSAQDSRSQLQARIEAIKRMLDVNPNQLAPLIQLGSDYFDLGNYQKAIDAYKKALLINPKNADVLTDLGTCYRRIGEPQQAVKAFRKAHEVDPNHMVSLFNLGIVLRDDLKQPAEALKAWKEFLRRAPDSPHAVMVRPWVEKLQRELDQGSQTTGSGSKR